ncbi:MAG: glucosamine--fructose-6-phosphate aminotransferase [Chloroflexota bacterium]|nr:MAG: glucosamine--fructose-6-phosphate aminotransferase [Chloroflexota bacterium]
MTEQRGIHTFTEITSQPELWDKAVDAFQRQSGAFSALWEAGNFDQLLLTGCGSTYYLALAGAALFQRLTGISARAYPASEIALLPDLALLPKARPLLIAVSRSGKTTETLEAVRVFRERTGQPVVSVTCASASALSAQSDLAIAIDEAQEQSLAQTRSFACMLIVVEALAALAGRADSAAVAKLTPIVTRALASYHDLARRLGEDKQIERFFFLGSGPLYGIACEGMLKMKEMSLAYSEAFHVLEFRHGPMSMVNAQTLIVGLISDEAHPQEIAVLRQMHQRGAQVLALAEQDYGSDLAGWAHFVRLDTGLPGWARPVTYLLVLQLMAYYRALLRDQDPDRPTNLDFVISLDKSMT